MNILRQTLKVSLQTRLIIQRYQSQAMSERLNRKAPVEAEQNDNLEKEAIENTIEWNKKLKFHRLRGEPNTSLKIFEIGIRKYQYQPDYITFVSMLEICKEIKDVDNGRYIHRIIETSPMKSNSRIQYLLMVKCNEYFRAK